MGRSPQKTQNRPEKVQKARPRKGWQEARARKESRSFEKAQNRPRGPEKAGKPKKAHKMTEAPRSVEGRGSEAHKSPAEEARTRKNPKKARPRKRSRKGWEEAREEVQKLRRGPEEAARPRKG